MVEEVFYVCVIFVFNQEYFVYLSEVSDDFKAQEDVIYTRVFYVLEIEFG
jgi:hypothetical protein